MCLAMSTTVFPVVPCLRIASTRRRQCQHKLSTHGTRREHTNCYVNRKRPNALTCTRMFRGGTGIFGLRRQSEDSAVGEGALRDLGTPGTSQVHLCRGSNMRARLRRMSCGCATVKNLRTERFSLVAVGSLALACEWQSPSLIALCFGTRTRRLSMLRHRPSCEVLKQSDLGSKGVKRCFCIPHPTLSNLCAGHSLHLYCATAAFKLCSRQRFTWRIPTAITADHA